MATKDDKFRLYCNKHKHTTKVIGYPIVFEKCTEEYFKKLKSKLGRIPDHHKEMRGIIKSDKLKQLEHREAGIKPHQILMFISLAVGFALLYVFIFYTLI